MACANADTPASLLTQDAAETAVLCLINEERVAAGVPALSLNLKLRTAARQHATDAKTIKWWAGGGSQIHTNPVTGSTPKERIRAAGYCPAHDAPPTNENGYHAYYQGGIQFATGTTPQAAVTWWMNSQGHRDTLLDATYNESGVGVILGIPETGPGPDAADGGVIVVQTFGQCEVPETPGLGEIWSWGKNDGGQLGDGTTTDRHRPVHLEKLDQVVTVAAGRSHCFGLLSDGRVLAWGRNSLGELGDGTTTDRLAPAPLTTITDVQAIAAGSVHSVAVLRDGTLFGWGGNASGQVGDGTFDDRDLPVQLTEVDDIIAVDAGYAFSLALTRNGSVWAWGSNNWGQLGDGTSGEPRPAPGPVAGFNDIVAISAGFEQGLAIRKDGSVWGWGSNHSGQLGDGTTQPRDTPVKVEFPQGVGPIVAVSGGGFHGLALGQDGRVWVWGGNGYGQLGTGDRTDRLTPVQHPTMSQVIAVAAGFGHSLALKEDGSVWAWGMNSYGGQVGDNTTIDRPNPIRVQTLPARIAVSAGGASFHTLTI